MRTASHHPGREVTIEFEGRALPALVGESIAAALAASGIREMRETRTGGRRGLFCGMGVCQDCLVEVDGRTNQRACMTKVTAGQVIRRQRFPGRASFVAESVPPIDATALPVETPDILVVGGGAGGLAAAAFAAEQGADVLLVDERSQLGGQYFKQPVDAHGADPASRRDTQSARGLAAIEKARSAGVRIVSGSEIWGAFEPLQLGATWNGCTRVIQPKRLIVATGAYERALPIPGWTLPGVITTGAMQTMLRSYSVVVGQRIVVAGNGPLNLQVAYELVKAGARVVAVVESAPRPGLRVASALLRMAVASPHFVRDGLRYVARLKRAGVPILFGHVLAEVASQSGALRATIGKVGDRARTSTLQLEADTVCMGYGFNPSNEILMALGCEHHFDPERGHLITRRGDDCETSVPGVYAVGDCCGLGGAHAAAEEGLIAAAAVIADLGRGLSQHAREEVAAARVRLTSHRRFQTALWQVFAAPRFHTQLATAETLICRCEEVSLSEVEDAIRDGNPSIGEVKRRTRLGMGRCQGRYCAPVLAALLAEKQGRPLDQMASFAPRAPIKPVSIADLTGCKPHDG
jgi:D-hydroxyproline dehydrogenase subunit alpha